MLTTNNLKIIHLVKVAEEEDDGTLLVATTSVDA
jgi:hypothetical protein